MARTGPEQTKIQVMRPEQIRMLRKLPEKAQIRQKKQKRKIRKMDPKADMFLNMPPTTVGRTGT